MKAQLFRGWIVGSAALAASACCFGPQRASAELISDVTAPLYSPVLNNGNRYVWRVYDGDTSGTDPSLTSWLAENATAGSVTLALGGLQQLSSIDVWNYNEGASGNTDRGARNVAVYVSSDYGASYSLAGNYEIPQAPGNAGITPYSIALANVNATHVRIDLLDNWGDPTYVGLNEVQFNGTVLTPTVQLSLQGVTASSEYTGRLAAETIDDVIYSTDGNTGMWLAQQPNELVWLTLDQGQINRLHHLKVWNYNEDGFGSRGAASVNVMLSSDGVNWTAALNAVDNTTTFNLYAAPGSLNITPSSLYLATPTDARFVMLTNFVNHGASGDFVGLTEVRAFGEVIPEPGTVALLALGGAAAFGLRRIRRRMGAFPGRLE